MSPANPELLLAEDFVRHTGCNVFLTGKAGTGKTTFLHAVSRTSPKRLVVTAPTGVAAINAGGVTLHSFFQLPSGPFVPGSDAYAARHRMRREKKQIIQSLDLLIIQRNPLRELKATLGEDCSYGDIKRVLAHLEHIQKH